MSYIQVKGYKTERAIGAGSFGQVFLVEHKSSTVQFALKKIKKQHQSPKAIQQEVDAGKLLNHPNIVKVREHFEDDEYAYIVTDFVPGTKKLFGKTN
jgi:serine/threonine protein kinase